ncbi:MAG: APC family permease [Promethearchaeota archaeon]
MSPTTSPPNGSSATTVEPSPSQEESSPKEVVRKPRWGLRQMLSLGLGGTIGGPIFVILGYVIFTAQAGSLLSLALSGLLMLSFVLIYSELALSLPIAGGGYSFSKEAIGGVQGFLIGWLIWVGNLLFAALSGLGFAESIAVFFPNRAISPLTIVIVGALIIIIFYSLSLKYPKVVRSLSRIFTFAILSGFVIYIFVGLAVGSQLNPDYSTTILSEPSDFRGIISMTGYTFIIYCVYEWNSTFESLTTAFDRIKQPRKTIPRAFVISILIGIVIYWLVTLTTILNMGSSESGAWTIITSSGAPLADAFEIVLQHPIGMYFMGLVGMIATMTSIISGIQMSTHILHSMSRDGFVHRVVRREKNGVQWVAMSLSLAFIILFTFILDISLIAEISNFIFLLSMIFLALSVIILRKTRPKLIRPWKVPLYPYLPIVSILLGVILILAMFFNESSLWGVVAGLIIVILGGIYYLFQIARRDRISLLIYGAKFGGCLLLGLLFYMLNIRLSFGILTSSFHGMFHVVTWLVVFLGLFDVVPIRRWILFLTRKKRDAVVVAGLTQYSEKDEQFARLFNIITSSILIFVGALLGLTSLLISQEVIFVASSIDSLQLSSITPIVVVIFSISAIIFTINGLLRIFLETERRKMSTPSQ